MNSSQRHLAQCLTYMGVIPFLGSVLNEYFQAISIDNALVIRSYAALIISFLSGIHWAAFLFFSDKISKNLLIISNIIALLAWVALLSSSYVLGLLLLIICFVYLCVIDSQLAASAIIPQWFYHLRRNATILVVLGLVCFIGITG